MTLRKILLGTSAVVGAAMLTVGAPGRCRCCRGQPGGALDLTLTGFLRAEFGGGEYDDSQLDNSFARGLDFRNDSEVHVLARGKSEETGLEYGATVEFEADTNQSLNTDETWIFMRGGWGEVRLGDEDGVADNSAVGAQTIAAGTGGIDGSSFVADRGADRLHHQHQRRHQGPLLHAELRRVQRRRVVHADPEQHRQRRQQWRQHRPQERRHRDAGRERGRRRPRL